MPGRKDELLIDGEAWDEYVFKNKHDCINEWLTSKHSTGNSKRTLNAYSRIANRFFHDHFPDTHPSDVTVGDVEQYVQALAQRDCSTNTKRRYVETLSAFYDWAMKRPRFENITGNPAGVVLEELPTTRRERPETATWENGKKVIWHITDPRDKTAASVMAKTGARVREVATLKEEDLLLDEGFIRFRNRKGGRSTVNPIDDETINAIRRLQVTKSHDSEWVFISVFRVAVVRVCIVVWCFFCGVAIRVVGSGASCYPGQG